MIKQHKVNSYKYIQGKGFCKCKSMRYAALAGRQIAVHGRGIFDIIKTVVPMAINAGMTGKHIYKIAKDSKEMYEGKPEIDAVKKRRIIDLIDEISGSGFNCI